MKTKTKTCKNYFFTKLTHKHGISLITLQVDSFYIRKKRNINKGNI